VYFRDIFMIFLRVEFQRRFSVALATRTCFYRTKHRI